LSEPGGSDQRLFEGFAVVCGEGVFAVGPGDPFGSLFLGDFDGGFGPEVGVAELAFEDGGYDCLTSTAGEGVGVD